MSISLTHHVIIGSVGIGPREGKGNENVSVFVDPAFRLDQMDVMLVTACILHARYVSRSR